MTTGERIRRARQEAGLSQRQLAGETITRNMLSLLEHDQANPSLETLRFLARRLDRPVSYFLGEETAQTDGYARLCEARQALADGDYARALELAARLPDGEVLGPEREMLWAEATLARAEQALNEGRSREARTILTEAAGRMERLPYAAAAQNARRAVLLARADPTPETVGQLPDIDAVLLLRAEDALARQDPEAAGRSLEAVTNRDARWQVLRGNAYFAAEAWELALECYRAAEPELPLQVRRGLQLCYARLGNFEKAYEYATME